MFNQKTVAAFSFVYSAVAMGYILLLICLLGMFCAFDLLLTKNAVILLLINIIIGGFGFFFTKSFFQNKASRKKVCLMINIVFTFLCIFGVIFIPELKMYYENQGFNLSLYLTSVFLTVFVFTEIIFLTIAGFIIALDGLKAIKKRKIFSAIALSILTLGLFFFYWIYQLIQSVILAENKGEANSAGELFRFIFLPFYSSYWCYTRAKKIFQVQQERGIKSQNQAVLCLVFYIIGLPVVSLALLQKELNKLVQIEEQQSPA